MPDTAVKSSKRTTKAARQPKLRYRAECTVPDCGWKGEPASSQKRAKKPIAEHAIEKHSEIRSVMVRRVVVNEVVEE